MIGSVIGFWLAPKLGIQATSTIGSYGVAFGGSVLLIMALRFLGVFK